MHQMQGHGYGIQHRWMQAVEVNYTRRACVSKLMKKLMKMCMMGFVGVSRKCGWLGCWIVHCIFFFSYLQRQERSHQSRKIVMLLPQKENGSSKDIPVIKLGWKDVSLLSSSRCLLYRNQERHSKKYCSKISIGNRWKNEHSSELLYRKVVLEN